MKIKVADSLPNKQKSFIVMVEDLVYLEGGDVVDTKKSKKFIKSVCAGEVIDTVVENLSDAASHKLLSLYPKALKLEVEKAVVGKDKEVK